MSRPLNIRRVLFGITIVLGLLVLADVLLIRIFRPNLNQGEAVTQATASLQKVGGVEEVRKEAERVFAKFGVSRATAFYSQSELKDFPALTGLGTVCLILPNPACLTIRSGNHLDGYTIEIYQTNYSIHEFDHSTLTQLGPGIYVHR